MNGNSISAFDRMAAVDLRLTSPGSVTEDAFKGGMIIASQQNIPISKVFGAMAEGASGVGEQLLLRTLSAITKYLTAWGGFVILILGLFQLYQASAAVLEKVVGIFKAVASTFGAVTGWLAGLLDIFHKKDGEAEMLIKSSVTLVTASVPEVGVCFGILSQFLGSPRQDRVGGVMHDEPNFGQVPVRPSNFTMVDEDEMYTSDEVTDIALDIASDVATAAVRAGADPIMMHDLVERVLHDEVALTDEDHANGLGIVEDAVRDALEDDDDE